MIGRTLGHHQILEKLGGGGMGDVYAALDTQLSRKVALKLLRPEAASSAERRNRFEREAKTIAALHHPQIVTVYSIEEAEGLHYITMEWVEGKTLEALIPTSGMDLGRFLELASPIADALSAAHQSGVTHRDLKPANIMVDESGKVKVLDFGLAKLRPEPSPPEMSELPTESLTREGVLLGTPAYMSPEQAEGKSVDHRSDIFSLGVTFYQMLTGQRPFSGSGPASILASILHHTPPTLTEIRPELPSDVGRIVRRCLAKDPERRFQTATDLRNELEEIAEELKGHQPRPASARPRGARWLVAAVGVGAVILALLSLALFRGRSMTTAWTIRPVTNFVGYEDFPSSSPDGTFVAYADDASGSMDIFVMSSGGGRPVRLTDSPADEVSPRWSPDGRLIAFVSDRGRGTQIYLVPPLGGAERQLVETGIPYLERMDEAWATLGAQPWSPDSKEVVFSRAGPSGGIALWKVELETGQETQLSRPPQGSDDVQASWAFDGRRIVFCRRRGGLGSLWLLSATDGTANPLVEDENDSFQPAWSADGRRVVFASTRAGSVNLWEVDVQAKRARQITTGTWDWSPSVARDGKLLYTGFLDQSDLYWLELGAGEERLTFNTSDNFAPRISPDRERIVYQSNRTGNDEIWVLDRATGTERPLTQHPAWDTLPDWSPDGQEIAFLSNREGKFQLWVMNAEGGAPRRLGSQEIPVNGYGCTALRPAPRWSPDGKSIGYLAPGEQGIGLWVVDRDGGDARPRLWGALRFDWYRDSRRVIYTRVAADGSGAREMVAAHLETGEEVVLDRGPNVELVASPDGRGVIYAHSESHVGQQLYLLPLLPPESAAGLPRGQGNARQLTHGRGDWHVHNGGWSADGRSFVYTRTVDRGDIYAVENYR